MNNTYEKLKPYRKNPTIFIISIIAYIIIIGLLGFRIAILLNDNEMEDSTQFYLHVPIEDEYYYIDAIECTAKIYIYNGEVYYLVYDNDYANIVTMTKTQFEELSEQYQYHLDGDETEYNIPEPYRIYGQAKIVPENVVAYFMLHYDITEEEFNNYLGNYYLEIQTNGIDYASLGRFCMYEFFFVGSFIGFCILNGKNIHASRKTFNRLFDLNEMEKAVAELNDASNISFDDENYTFTQNYIFSRKFKSITKYEDLLLIYGNKNQKSHLTVVTVVTKLKLKYIIMATYGNFKTIIEIIKEKNPEIRIGLNEENKAFYKNYFKYQ